MCIDEHYESGKCIFLATGPILDARLGWHICDEKDLSQCRLFYDKIKDIGVSAKFIITDAHHIYKGSLAENFPKARHQLCIFHVIQDINSEILKAVREIKNSIPRPRLKRGRPRKGRRRRKIPNIRRFVFKAQYLIVKRRLTGKEKRVLYKLYKISAKFRIYRAFIRRIHKLFGKYNSKKRARMLRSRIINDKRFRADLCIRKILKRLASDDFEKMIAFLSTTHKIRTNNHIERDNRRIRKRQKSCYNRRTNYTIDALLKLDTIYSWQNRDIRKTLKRIPGIPKPLKTAI